MTCHEPCLLWSTRNPIKFRTIKYEWIGWVQLKKLGWLYIRPIYSLQITLILDYVSDVEKIANNDKDWGISLLIPSEVPQTTESPRKNNKPSEVTIKNNQIEDFCNFLKDVLRVKIHNFPSKTTASPQPEPKRSKQEQEVLPYTNNGMNQIIHQKTWKVTLL